LAVNDLAAHNTTPDRPTARPPDRPPELTVYLMTMGPGKKVWERFGHNAIWIHDPVRGTDQAYNYGLFDFGQEQFLLRFLQGRMWYWMQGFPAQAYVNQYRRDNRSVWIQELEIPMSARRELQEFLEWNERPENRFYHYDYYYDNCSTRVRDALDRALDGSIQEQMSTVSTGRTFRFHTLRLTENDPPIYTGLLLALGQPVDRPISAWEEMFLPLALREHLRRVTVTGPDGRPTPLVKSEQTLYESSLPTPPEQPPVWLPAYLVSGLVIGGSAWGFAATARRSRLARITFLMVALIWALVAGVGGLVIAGLWALTDHEAVFRNENILQADLLVLPLLWLVPRLLFGTPDRARLTSIFAFLVVGLSLFGLLLKLFPPFYQVNGAIIALALPAHAGIAAGVWQLTRSQGLPARRAPSLASAKSGKVRTAR
jgi:hypothetical protein